MNRISFLIYSIAACVLALAGLLYAIGSVNVVAAQKSAAVAEGSPWPTVLLSAFVLVTGVAAQHHLVARPGKPRSFQDQVQDQVHDTSPIAIAAICGLGLLVSLCAALYGWDLNAGLSW